LWGWPGLQEIRLGSGMRLTDAAAAEAADAVGGRAAYPAPHTVRLTFRRQGGGDGPLERLQQRAGAEGVHADFAGGLLQGLGATVAADR
jgi:hypothetical protein